MAKPFDKAITEAEKQRQIELAYNMYVSARKLLVPPDRGVFAMGFAMGMRRGYALAGDEDRTLERIVTEALSDA